MHNERILMDTYRKDGKTPWSNLATEEFSGQITAANAMYGWIYESGKLKDAAFQLRDYSDMTYFALDAQSLLPYREEMLQSGIEGAELAVNLIFDADIKPCEYSGAIQLTAPMRTFRDFDGTVERSWECSLVQSLNSGDALDVQAVMEEKGARAAAEVVYALNKFKQSDIAETLAVRALTEEDYAQVKALDILSGNDVVLMLDSEDYAWGLFQGTELVGYCTIGGAEELGYESYAEWKENALCLSDVFVKEEHRGNGFASKLVNEAMSKANPENAPVFISLLDDGLRHLYEKVGFRHIEGGNMVKQSETLDTQKQRLFVDMDGTLAVFTPVDELEQLYEPGYFLNLEPHANVVEAVKDIIENQPDIEVHILSAVLMDSEYALEEKNAWLDMFLPEIDQAHRVFVPCGSDKKDGIPGGVRESDFLLDDYTKNLNDWQPPARGIKLLNAINHTRGSWLHDRIRYDRAPSDLANGIVSIMQGKERVFDEPVVKFTDSIQINDVMQITNLEFVAVEEEKSEYLVGILNTEYGKFEVDYLIRNTETGEAMKLVDIAEMPETGESPVGAETRKEIEKALGAYVREQREPVYEIRNEVVSSYSGQTNCELTAYDAKGKALGYIQYAEFRDVPHIQYIETKDEFRRQGVATRLMQELQSLYEGKEINWGMTTEDGTKLYEAITYTVENAEVKELTQRLNATKAALQENEAKLNALYAIEEPTQEQSVDIERLGDQWELLTDEIRKLELEIDGRAAEQVFVKMPEEREREERGVTMDSMHQEFVGNLARYDFLRNNIYADGLAKHTEQRSEMLGEEAMGIYRAALRGTMDRHTDKLLAMRDGGEYRFVALTSEHFGDRNARHEIAYNQLMTPDQIMEFTTDPSGFLEHMYADLGNAGAQPSNYYGHSPSVGDAFVIMTPGGVEGHYIAPVGFEKHEGAIRELWTEEQQREAALGMTVREEMELLDNMEFYANVAGYDSINAEIKERLDFLHEEYVPVFNLAEIRKVLETQRDKLEVLYQWEKDNVKDPIVRDKFDGEYILRDSVMRWAMEFGQNNEIMAGEKLLEEINERFETAAQKISEENDIVYRQHASHRPLGENRQYNFFVQRYEREEDGHGLIPREILCIGDARQTIDVANHLRTSSELGEEISVNAFLRRQLGMPVLEGEAALNKAGLMQENNRLTDEMNDRIDTVTRAMEAAGYSLDGEETTVAEPVFRGEGGARMQFTGVKEAEEWLDGVVFDDPSVARAVEKIMHPERFEEAQNLVTVQSASRANYKDMVVLSQFDREQGAGGPEKIYLGKAVNYNGRGEYDNSDNSLVYISNNGKMFSFLDASAGWAASQQEMIDSGAFTVADYAEFAILKEGLLRQFEEIAPKQFEISIMDDSKPTVPFRYPNWTGEAQDKLRVAIESTEDYSVPGFHSELVDTDIRNEDGSYGRIVEKFRIATLNEESRVVAYDSRVFATAEEARAAVQEDPELELISYDRLIDDAYAGMGITGAQRKEQEMDAETELAEKIVNFLEQYDPAFGYAEGVEGQENKEQWVETMKSHLADQSIYTDMLNLAAGNPEAQTKAEEIIRLYTELTGQQIEREQPSSPFIASYYVVNDLQKQGQLDIVRYDNLEKALAGYAALPTDRMKAMGIENTNQPYPGSLDFIQCKDGVDTFVRDYERVSGWDNPEIHSAAARIAEVVGILQQTKGNDKLDYGWALVNSAETRQDVISTETLLKWTDFENKDYDNLMMALSQISRETYRAEREEQAPHGDEVREPIVEERKAPATIQSIEQRLAEIKAERQELYERQYQYGYIAPRQTLAKLYQEERELKQVLEVVANYDIASIRAELNNREITDMDTQGDEGVAKYSYFVLGRAERVLTDQDPELTERMKLGDNFVDMWEKQNGDMAAEMSHAAYDLIYDKSIPLNELEARIQTVLAGDAPEQQNGDAQHFRIFYDYQLEQAREFQNEQGWKMLWGSDAQGLNGDSFVVYRDITDLPKYLRDYAKEMEAVGQVENHYYEPALELDGTAEVLFTQARNGYIESPEALARLQEILTAEQKHDKALYVGVLKEIAEHNSADERPYVFAQMKKDILDGVQPEEVTLRGDATLTVMKEGENVLISLQEYDAMGERDLAGATTVPEYQFVRMSAKEFEETVNAIYAYGMVEQERETEQEREVEITIGEYACVKVDEWQDGNDTYVLGNALNDSDFYYAIVNGKQTNIMEYDEKPSREKIESDYADLEAMRDIDRREAEVSGFGQQPNIREMEQEQTPQPYIVLQKDDARYTFSYRPDIGRYNVERMQNLTLGASVSFQSVSVDEAMKRIADLKENGFNQFRTAQEVSWYATTANNSPYPEVWMQKDGYHVPVNSHSAQVKDVNALREGVVQELKDRGYETVDASILDAGMKAYDESGHFNRMEGVGSVEAIATYIENTELLENPIGNDDWYYNSPQRGDVQAVYFNPDSSAGGQFVEMSISYTLINEAAKEAKTPEEFFDILNERAPQALVDIDTVGFRDSIQYYTEHTPDFTRSNDAETMQKLIEVAKDGLSREAIVELAGRVDNFMYKYHPQGYDADVGTSYEARAEHRAHLADALEHGEFSPLIDTLTEALVDYRDSNEGEFDWEIREAGDLLYSLKHLDQYQQYHDRETTANAQYPIREFMDNNGHMVDGYRISVVMSRQPGFADRSLVFNAVARFEEANNIPQNERVIHNGSYEDKEFLYMAYNRYMGMSHQNDLAIQPYMERLQALAENSPNAYSLLPLVAEVYYAQQSRLTPQQIDFILDNVKQEQFPESVMSNLRQGFESGLTEEQLSVVAGEAELTQENLLNFMVEGGSVEDAKALKGADIASYYNVARPLRNGEISREMAQAIVQGVKHIRDWNNADWNRQREENPEDVNARFNVFFLDYFPEYLTEQVLADKSITPEMVSTICKEFVEQKDTNNLREFIEQNGGFKAFAEPVMVETNMGKMPVEDYREIFASQHGFDSYIDMYKAGYRIGNGYDKEPEGSETMAKEEKVVQEGVNLPEEKKDPKEQLTQQLQEGVRNVLNSEQFKNWLDTSSKMFLNNYSFNNAMLVWFQKPDATHTMGYEQWKDYGRNVAKGAQGIKIFTPVIAYEKKTGELWRMIKSNLDGQMKANPSLEQASYRVGMSKLEITMNRNGLYGLRVNGKEQTIKSEKDMQNFIKHNVLGKVPMYFTVGTVFDAKDTVIPEYLWMKKGFTKSEMALDESGKPIKNKRGEYKIINTPERQAKFQPKLDMEVPQQDPAKMAILYDALKAVSQRNGIPVYEKARAEDEVLRGGADGYYSRAFSEEHPKGYIVLPSDLDPTKSVSVLLHEMAHSELHGDLKRLAEKMGEDKVPSKMREIQAESVAYLVGKNFGIESDTSSFNYLAAFTQGFELQNLSKSIEVIYNECKQLTKELSAELEVRGLNMDLSQRDNAVMSKESVETIASAYISYAVEQSDRIMDIEKELPDLAEQHKGKDRVIATVVFQCSNIQRQKEDISAITEQVEALNNAQTFEEQAACIGNIEAAKTRIEEYKAEFNELTAQFQELLQTEQGLKDRFVADPIATLKDMGENMDYVELGALSDAQIQYLAKSEYVSRELAPLLRNDPQQFVDKACERASQLEKVAAKNGVFVEVTFCEQWTDKPIVQKGALLHPKVADTIVKQAEAQIRALKAQAESVGEYFPYNKCALTVYQADKGQIATAFKTRVDIGDGTQASLVDHLKQIYSAKDIAEAFEKATREKGAKDKVLFNDAPAAEQQQPVAEVGKEDRTETRSDRAMTHEAWAKEISAEKEAEQSETEQPKQERQEQKQAQQGKQKNSKKGLER